MSRYDLTLSSIHPLALDKYLLIDILNDCSVKGTMVIDMIAFCRNILKVLTKYNDTEIEKNLTLKLANEFTFKIRSILEDLEKEPEDKFCLIMDIFICTNIDKITTVIVLTYDIKKYRELKDSIQIEREGWQETFIDVLVNKHNIPEESVVTSPVARLELPEINSRDFNFDKVTPSDFSS